MIPAIALLGKEDLFTQIDGFNLLVPRCKIYPDCRARVANEINFSMPGFAPEIGQIIGFSDSIQDPFTTYFLANGWSYPESWGTWSSGHKASIYLPLPKKSPHSLELQVNAFVTNTHPVQIVRIMANDESMTETILTKAKDNRIVIPISSKLSQKPYLHISFEFLNSARPKDKTESNADKRELAIGIVSAKFH